MRPETPAWRGAPPAPFAYSGFCVLGLLRARGTFVLGMFGAFFVSALCFLGLRCADAGHPPGLFAE